MHEKELRSQRHVGVQYSSREQLLGVHPCLQVHLFLVVKRNTISP